MNDFLIGVSPRWWHIRPDFVRVGAQLGAGDLSSCGPLDGKAAVRGNSSLSVAPETNRLYGDVQDFCQAGSTAYDIDCLCNRVHSVDSTKAKTIRQLLSI